MKTYGQTEFPNNAVKITPNGVRTRYNATAWKDMIMDISGRRLNSNQGRVDYNWANNSIKFQSSGSLSNVADRVQGNQQINHEFKIGTSVIFKPHIHWFQPIVDSALDTTPYIISLNWRLIRNGWGHNLTGGEWTTITCEMGSGGDDILSYDADKLNTDATHVGQLSRFDNIVVDCSVSDTLQMQMARTDSETGDIWVYFMDTHGMVDGFGSEDEILKYNYE